MKRTPSSTPALLLLPALLLACGDKEEDAESGCTDADFPASASDPDGVLDGWDDCGLWALAVGDHAYINVVVSEAEVPCDWDVSGGVVVPYDPTYSNMSDDDPKWTFDVEATETGDGELDVSCDDGSTWTGRFVVGAK